MGFLDDAVDFLSPDIPSVPALGTAVVEDPAAAADVGGGVEVAELFIPENTSGKRDLSEAAKQTLGAYLSNETTGKHTAPSNKFPISPPGEESRTYLDQIRDVQDQGADANQGADAKFDLLSTSDYGRGENPFTEILDKGSEQKGHTLLPSIKTILDGGDPGAPNVDGISPPDDAPEIQKKISMVLKNNRFHPEKDTPFIENHEQKNLGYTIQNTLGEYKAGAEFSAEAELKGIGLSLMINATGHGVFAGASTTSPGPNGATSDTVLLPSFTQLGAMKVSVDKLRAQNAAGADKVGGNPPSDYLSLDNQQSYGQLNSYLEPFDGPLPMGMVVVCLTGIVGLVAFSALMSLVTGGFHRDVGPLKVPKDPEHMEKGSHIPSNFGGNLLDLLGIPRTDNHFMKCMFEGICAFYGLPIHPKDIKPGPAALDVVVNLAMAPGYYAVVTRAVVRDVEQIIDAFKGFANPLGFSGAATQVLKVIESIVTSTTWRFLMTMVKLGDLMLHSTTGHPRLAGHYPGGGIDDLVETSTTRVMKSRVPAGKKATPGGHSTMAWRHSSSPARYILPASFVKGKLFWNNTPDAPHAAHSSFYDQSDDTAHCAPADLNGDASGLGSGNASFEPADDATRTVGRLSGDYVEYIENRLESEYMPFYFHDLRTNEIISFHAFIDSMSDGFSVDYSSTSGYGRVDDVKIYNKTSRSISMSFSLVATSKEDLSIMYFNVNKLVAMCYPQWSRGRLQIANDADGNEFKFIQPFSQIPTASPMIRLRLGDWFKSNYSKFGVARLFGAGLGNGILGTLTDQEAADNAKHLAAAKDATAAWKAKLKEDPAGGGSPGAGFQEDDDVVGVAPETVRVCDKDGNPPPDAVKDDELSYTRSPIGWMSGKKMVAKVAKVIEYLTALGIENKKYRIHRVGDINARTKYVVKLDERTTVFTGGWSDDWKYIIFEHSTCNPTEKAEKDMLKENYDAKSPATPPNSAETMNAFVKDNPITKAFESTRGRGLAGFITQLDFDQSDVPWEIDRGYRAPQMLKVSISFSPIHDLAPGLDHDGMMTAPVYNVGDAVGSIGQDPHYDGFLGDDGAENEAASEEIASHTRAEGGKTKPQGNPSDESGGGGFLPF